MAMRGLDNYGYKNDARRLAQKYLDSNVRQYGQTGVLWEKYNAVTGNNDAAAEYETPGQFMGWTAGVVLFTIKYLY
jgi:alpha,alpha-trehalase